MAETDHLRLEDYQRSARHSHRVDPLPVRCHAHLVATCPECGESWRALGPILRDVVRDELAAAARDAPPPEPHRDDLSGSPEHLEALAARARDLRRQRRRAKKQLSELRQTPPHRRADKVHGAYRRFRSRHLAELLIEEARSVVRSAPAEAESFTSLVPLVLNWTRGEDGPTWTGPLVARAEAHRANALRVAGDLAAAERVLGRLDLSSISLISVRAEIWSLEASLRIDQRRFAAARQALDQAAAAYTYVGDRRGAALVRINYANLMQTLSQPADVLEHFEAAAQNLDTDCAPELLVSTVSGRINALCDLDRPLEARRLLEENSEPFEAIDSPYVSAFVRMLEGRISLGLEEHGAAEEHLTSAITAFNVIGRPYDAASVSLFLAESYLAQGRTRELRRLSAVLIQDFRERGVEGEAMKALQLFAKAVGTESVTLTLLEQFRKTLGSAS